jgi:hypothetical protein
VKIFRNSEIGWAPPVSHSHRLTEHTGHRVRARATAADQTPEARAPPATRSAPWRLCCPCALTKTRPYLLEAEAKKPFSSSHSPSLALLSHRAATLLCSVLCRASSSTPQATIAPSDCVASPSGAALITNLLGLAPGSFRVGFTTEAPKSAPVAVVEKNAPSPAHSGERPVQPPPPLAPPVYRAAPRPLHRPPRPIHWPSTTGLLPPERAVMESYSR